MTVHGFIEKFDSIPESKWTIGTLQDSLGSKCALGHLGGWISPLSQELAEIFHQFIKPPWPDGLERTFLVADINDGAWGVKGTTPKERILNTLYEIAQQQAVSETHKILHTHERAYTTGKRRSGNKQIRKGSHSVIR